MAQHLKHLRRDNEQLRTNFDDVRSIASPFAPEGWMDAWDGVDLTATPSPRLARHNHSAYDNP